MVLEKFIDLPCLTYHYLLSPGHGIIQTSERRHGFEPRHLRESTLQQQQQQPQRQDVRDSQQQQQQQQPQSQQQQQRR